MVTGQVMGPFTIMKFGKMRRQGEASKEIGVLGDTYSQRWEQDIMGIQRGSNSLSLERKGDAFCHI